MGSIFKQKVTRPLPANASIQQRKTKTGIELVATWQDRSGKKRSAVVVTAADGSQRIRTEPATYYAKYRDGNNILREVPTGCRDKQAAMTKLTELEKRAERVRSGVLSDSDLQIAANLNIAILNHLKDYIQSMKSAGVTRSHIDDTKRKIEILTGGCGFVRLRDIKAEAVESWLVNRQKENRLPEHATLICKQLTG